MKHWFEQIQVLVVSIFLRPSLFILDDKALTLVGCDLFYGEKGSIEKLYRSANVVWRILWVLGFLIYFVLVAVIKLPFSEIIIVFLGGILVNALVFRRLAPLLIGEKKFFCLIDGRKLKNNYIAIVSRMGAIKKRDLIFTIIWLFATVYVAIISAPFLAIAIYIGDFLFCVALFGLVMISLIYCLIWLYSWSSIRESLDAPYNRFSEILDVIKYTAQRRQTLTKQDSPENSARNGW